MIPTVREVLGLPVLAAGLPEVVGGGAHLDRAVRWVHVSDADDLTGLLQGGELVLSTGSVLTLDTDRVTAYLKMLAALRVVGLIVELGTHIADLPRAVGALADQLGLPLVTLHNRIRYIDVTEQVHRLIVADRYQELQFAQSTHAIFTSLNIACASPRDIVAKASELLEEPVVLEDLSRRVLAFATANTPPSTLLDGWAERSRRNVITGDGGGWMALPVGVDTDQPGSGQWGRLVLAAGARDRGRARMVLERAAQSLQLQRMLEADREAVLVQALGGLLDDLLHGRVADDAEAMVRAGALGMAASARYVPLAIAIVRDPAGDALAQGAIDRQVLAAARQAVTSAGLTAIVSIRREGTVALLIGCHRPGAVDSALAAVCAGLAERLTGRLVDVSWAAGTAPAEAGLIAAASRLAEAQHVAEVGVTMGRRQRLYRSGDVRLRGLLALLRSDPYVQSFADTELGRLIDHDQRTGEDLLGVLRAYLLSGGSKSDAAAAAGLSRPTLYARLATIERLLGVTLDSADSRTSLHAALMIIDGRRG